MLEYIPLFAGLFLLIIGANYLVKGASSVGKILHISPLIIGLTVLAFGTSVPELVINLFSSFRGSTDINLGNIIGSNIANILLVLGVSSSILVLRVNEDVIKKGLPFILFSTVVLMLLANDSFFNGPNILSKIDGIILMIFFGFFLHHLYTKHMKDKKIIKVEKLKVKVLKPKKRPYALTVILILGGIVALFAGGKLVIDSSIQIAKNLGFSEFLISATILAIGTSLPELIVSIVAAFKKKLDFVVGNIVGSNIFNTFMILGISSFIRPIPFNMAFNFDLLFLLAITIMLMFLIHLNKKKRLEKFNSILFLSLYVFYLVIIFFRG